VSTNGQDYNGQIAELQATGCERIYREKVSGAKSDRAELAKLLKALTAGDVVIVSRLDRLARSTLDLLTILRRVTEAGAKFRSLKDPWADTTTPHGELTVTILAGLATFERHLIKTRTDDGRRSAQARGVRFGRPPKLFQRQEALQRLANGESQAGARRRPLEFRCAARKTAASRLASSVGASAYHLDVQQAVSCPHVSAERSVGSLDVLRIECPTCGR
jgi:DNA invertase Pin-like site-specific DNA recombinase